MYALMMVRNLTVQEMRKIVNSNVIIKAVRKTATSRPVIRIGGSIIKLTIAYVGWYYLQFGEMPWETSKIYLKG